MHTAYDTLLLAGRHREARAAGGMAGAVIHAVPELAATLRAALPADAPLLTVGGTVAGGESFGDGRGAAKALPPVPRPAPEDPGFIFYTSGTTGLPKGAVIPHRASEPRLLRIATQAGLRHGGHNRTLAFMPLSHCIGFFGVFLVTLAMDAPSACRRSSTRPTR